MMKNTELLDAALTIVKMDRVQDNTELRKKAIAYLSMLFDKTVEKKPAQNLETPRTDES